MSDQYLHGVKIIEKDDGARPIQTVSSSVIGVAGTAPDSESSVAASVTIGRLTTGITYTAVKKGNDGNSIKIEYINQGTDSELSVEVSGKIIKVSVATSSTGVVESTAEDVKKAVDDSTEAKLLVKTELVTDGSGLIDSFGIFYLSGGLDEAFPLNTPISVSASETTKLSRLGNKGTLPWIMDIISVFDGHLCVIVRVEEGSDEEETAANIAGSASDGTGLWALLDAQSKTSFSPRIIGAPGYTHVQTVANDLLTVSERLRGYGYIDAGENSTEEEALQYRQKFGSEFGMIMWPYVFDSDRNGNKVKRPLSAYGLGLRATVDNNKGWNWTMSNQPVSSIIETVVPVSFRLDDPNSTANRVNQNHITTIVNTGSGFVMWGCRSLTTDPKKLFESWGRAKGVIYDSLVSSHQWAVDRNITTTYVEDVTNGVNSFLSDLKSQGYILNGVAWADEELNSASSIMMGKFYWNFDYAVPAPAEQMSFVAHPQNSSYFDDIV